MKKTKDSYARPNDGQSGTFLRGLYDTQYYERMGCGYYRHFVENAGHSLPEWRMRDLHLLKLRPGMRLLDVGCARGELVMFCGYKGIDSYGVDFSEAALVIGRSRFNFYNNDEQKRIHLICADVSSLPFPDAYFDRVMSWALVEHLFQWQLENFLSEVYRVLRTDGVLVLETHPNEWYEKIGYRIVRPVKQLFLSRKLGTYSELRSLEPEHVNVKNPCALKRDLQRQGFFCYTMLLPRRTYEVNSGLARRLGWTLEKLPLFQVLFRNSIVVIATKSPRTLREFQIEKTKWLG